MYGVTGAAFGLSTRYQQHRSALESSVARLASGDRYARAGEEPASLLSISQRFRNRIRSADASTTSIRTAQAYLENANAQSEAVTHILQRMMEIASASTDGLMSDTDRTALQTEYKLLQGEITDLTRQAQFYGKSVVGREGLVSYDANNKRVRFWQSDGGDAQQIERDFSATALDATGALIGFDATEAFTMSGDGQSLYYMGTVAGDPGGTVRVKRYDIASHTVTYGAQTFSTGDTLYVDESDQLYVNGAGTAYTIDGTSLGRTATLVTDMRTGGDFSVYKGQVIYSRSADNAIVSTDPNTAVSTVLTTAPTFAAGTDHALSGSGRYVADEVNPGEIRVIDTRTGNSTSLVIGGANTVVNLQFNADGDRVYYINQSTAALHYIDVSTDGGDNVVLTAGAKVVQGVNLNSFNGLDMGGSTYGSTINYVVAQDNASVLSYGAVDLSLYNLGIANTRIDTLANANAAITDITTAQNQVAAERAKIGAKASRLQYVLSGHLSYIANIKGIESQIRDVDVAKETTRFSSEQVQVQAVTAIIAQFNTLSQNVLRLLS